MSSATKPKKLAVLHVPRTALEPNSWNPNRQSDAVYQAERESIERFGFIDPVTVRRHLPDNPDRFQIIDGEHRWRVAGEFEIETVPIIVLDVTEEEAKKLTVVLNETRGDADVVLLGQLLNDLKDLEDFRVALPYSDTDIEHLLSLGQEDWDRFTRDQNGAGPLPPPPVDVHETVLSYDDKHHDQFHNWVKICEHENGLTGQGISAVVYDAVRRVATAANQGK